MMFRCISLFFLGDGRKCLEFFSLKSVRTDFFLSPRILARACLSHLFFPSSSLVLVAFLNNCYKQILLYFVKPCIFIYFLKYFRMIASIKQFCHTCLKSILVPMSMWEEQPLTCWLIWAFSAWEAGSWKFWMTLKKLISFHYKFEID